MGKHGSKATIPPPVQIAPQNSAELSPEIKHLAADLGLDFEQPSLLIQALTHRSFVNENKHRQPDLQHNERLEFLGDAVIEFIAGDWLFQRFPNLREGQLTRLRSSLVCTEMLADFALICGLDKALRLGVGEEHNGGRQRKTNLCGAFEALMGALYLDQGAAAVQTFISQLFEPALESVLQKGAVKDAKSRLQEWSQTQVGNPVPRYHLLAALGPDHAKEFVVEVELEGVAVGWGTGRSKRRAEQAAAQMGLETVAGSES